VSWESHIILGSRSEVNAFSVAGARACLVLFVLVALVPQAIGAAAVPVPEWATAVLPTGAEIKLEIAADAVSRARGYMFRERVGPDEGMLFLFPSTSRHSIWMKNCKVALDIVWLDRELNVVEIAADQPPCPEDGPCPSIVPLRVARYVLELAAGGAKRGGLEVGKPVLILSEPALP